MRFRVFSGWASIAGLALLLGSCGGTPVNPNLPAIVTQPVNQTTTVGQTATFTVTASGQGPLSYQWYEFAEPLRNATSASYTTPIVAGSDNGSFFFVVISNSIGSTESDEVTLTVNTAPTITSATKATLLVGQAGSFIVTTLSTPVSTITETGAFRPASPSLTIVTVTRRSPERPLLRAPFRSLLRRRMVSLQMLRRISYSPSRLSLPRSPALTPRRFRRTMPILSR